MAFAEALQEAIATKDSLLTRHGIRRLEEVFLRPEAQAALLESRLRSGLLEITHD